MGSQLGFISVMSNRAWATTPELRALIAKAEANGASEWTVSAEDTTRAFLAEKERLRGNIFQLGQNWLSGIFSRLAISSISFDVPISELPRELPHPLYSCSNPVGVVDAVMEAENIIHEFISKAHNDSQRKPYLLLSRLSRGGKTTILRSLYNQLRKSDINALYVTFNPHSNSKIDGEAEDDALFRVITNELATRYKADRDSPRVVDWSGLNQHIGDSKFVLIIDEINMLSKRIKGRLSRCLRDYFIDPKDRFLVMSSHMPVFIDETSDDSSNYNTNSSAALSLRNLVLLPMPTANSVSELVLMDKLRCAGVTHNLMVYYGSVPSLVYVACTQLLEKPSYKFSFMGAMTDHSILKTFLRALITGIGDEKLGYLYPFCSNVKVEEKGLGMRYMWPPCYIGPILARVIAAPVALSSIVDHLDSLKEHSKKQGDGMTWEAIVAAATLINMQLSSYFGSAGPLDLCEAEQARDSEVLNIQLSEMCTTVDQAREEITAHCQEELDSDRVYLILFTPTHAAFEQFDGFVAFCRRGEVVRVCAYQCKDDKDGKAGGVGNVPEWINGNGWLFRSNPASSSNSTPSKRGWKYMTRDEVKKYLGYSLGAFLWKSDL